MNFSPCYLNTYNNIDHFQRSQTLQPIRSHTPVRRSNGFIPFPDLTDPKQFMLDKYFQSLVSSAMLEVGSPERANYANVPQKLDDYYNSPSLAAHQLPNLGGRSQQLSRNHHHQYQPSIISTSLHNQHHLQQHQPHHHHNHHQRQASSTIKAPQHHHHFQEHDDGQQHQHHNHNHHHHQSSMGHHYYHTMRPGDDLHRYYNIGYPHHHGGGNPLKEPPPPMLGAPPGCQSSTSPPPPPAMNVVPPHYHHGGGGGHQHHHHHQMVRQLTELEILQVCNELGPIDAPPALPPPRRYTITRTAGALYKVPFPQTRRMSSSFYDASKGIGLERWTRVTVLGAAKEERSKFTVCTQADHLDIPHQLTEPPKPQT